MTASVPEKNESTDKSKLGFKVVKAAVPEALTYMAKNLATDNLQCSDGKVELIKLVVSIAAKSAIEIGEFAYDRHKKSAASKENLDRNKELLRIFSSAIKFERLVIYGGRFPYCEIDGRIYHFEVDDHEIITLHEIKREGTYGDYSYKDSNPNLLDRLAATQSGSSMSAKLAEHNPKLHPHSENCVWLKRFLLPNLESASDTIVITQLKEQPRYKFDAKGYVEITLLESDGESVKKTGVLRLLSENGVKITVNGKEIQTVVMRTEQQDAQEKEYQRILKCTEERKAGVSAQLKEANIEEIPYKKAAAKEGKEDHWYSCCCSIL